MKYNTFYTCEKNKLVEHNPLYETTLTDAILRPRGETGLFTQNGVEVIKKDKSSSFEDCDYLSSFAVGLVSVGGIIFLVLALIVFVNNASTDRINRVAEAVETIEDSGYVNGVDYSYYRDSELFTVGDLYGLVTTFDTGVTVMIEDVWGVDELNGYLHNSNGTVDKSYITITSFSDTVELSKVLENSIGEDFKFTCDYMYKDSMHLIMCFTLQD